jgi:cytochrome c oxidase cbb3-type subunit 1
VTGASKATINWWFGHNTLGLWVTPVAIATSYYMIPKVIGKPIHSYHISLLGFWSLALFYNWAGTHHLVGGPLPAWVITVGIVGSMMMLIPVTTLAINHHLTMIGSFRMLKTSPTLRFVVFGSMMYTVASAQGSFEALREISQVAHFTHYTVGHAHLGLYGFFSMIMFGAYYYILPRLTRNEWSSAKLIRMHFWASALGVILYFAALTWAGWYQGIMMNTASIPFLKIVEYTKPYLILRSVGGFSMTAAHVSFAVLVWRIVRTKPAAETYGPTLFTTEEDRYQEVTA